MEQKPTQIKAINDFYLPAVTILDNFVRVSVLIYSILHGMVIFVFPFNFVFFLVCFFFSFLSHLED